MTYKEYYAIIVAQLREELTTIQAFPRGVDVMSPEDKDTFVKLRFGIDLTRDESINHSTMIVDLESTKEAYDEVMAYTPDNTDYFQRSTRRDYDLDAWSDGDGCVEVEDLAVFLTTSATVAKSYEQLDILLASEIAMKYIFRDYMKDILYIENGGDGYKRSPDCAVLKLYMQELITFENLCKAVYADC